MREIPLYVRVALVQWEWLALLAYETYCRLGRVALLLAEDPNIPGWPKVFIANYDYLHGKPELDIAHILFEYDPDREIVVQFIQSDKSVRTLCVRCMPDDLPPKLIYELNRLLQAD